MSRGLTTVVFIASMVFIGASFFAIRSMMYEPASGQTSSISRWIQINFMKHDSRDPREVEWARAEYQRRYPELTPEERVTVAEDMGLWEEADAARMELGDTLGVGGVDPLVVALGAGVVVIALGGVLLLGRKREDAPAQDSRTPTPAPMARAHDPEMLAKSAGGVDNLDVLRASDPMFSRPALYAYLQNLHRNAHWASVAHDWSGLRPFVDDRVRVSIDQSNNACREIGEIVLSTISARVVPDSRVTRLAVEMVGYREERSFDSRVHVVRFHDSWVLVRPLGCTSLTPEALVSLACPLCSAAPALTDDDGLCTSCHQQIADGRHGWRLVESEPRPRRPLEPLPKEVRFQTATSAPLLRDPVLDAALERFQARHPDFVLADFLQRTIDIFNLVQGACEDGAWRGLRPWLTDIAFEQVRFEHEQYEILNQVNLHRELRVDRLELARIDADPFYSSITVRFWWSMLDYVVDADGNLVDGDTHTPAQDSGYWTFQRVHGRGAVGGSMNACPKCGAEIAKVDETGTCTSCQAWLCDGSRWWVLARRDSVAAYHDG